MGKFLEAVKNFVEERDYLGYKFDHLTFREHLLRIILISIPLALTGIWLVACITEPGMKIDPFVFCITIMGINTLAIKEIKEKRIYIDSDKVFCVLFVVFYNIFLAFVILQETSKYLF